jgi:MFS family permease
MDKKVYGILSLPVIVAALGYFVDIYDLLLFSIVRVPSLKSLGLGDAAIKKDGLLILNIQMVGLLIGGLIWGTLADKKGRLKVLYASIILYSLGNIANGFVQNETQYALVRFISGLGLAGELGAGITLVSELLPKEKRGLGTSLVAGLGLMGAVFAYILKELFINDPNGWRICYFIGGGLGMLLLLLRIGILESGMFKSMEETKVSRGNFFMLFTDRSRLRKYILAILIGLPSWYLVGILFTFSDIFAGKMDIHGTVDSSKAVMVAYIVSSIGGVLIGFLSQRLQSRKKSLYVYFAIMAIGMIWFFSLHNGKAVTMYLVCALLGLGLGFWSIFVTMAAEQFGTNIRATVATTVPNMARGSLVLVSALFTGLQGSFDYLTSGWITGIVVMAIALTSVILSKETFHKDLNYLEA